MEIKVACVIFQLLVFTYFVQNSVGKNLVVSYWGQNSAGVAYPDNPEDELDQICQERQYDVIVIAFVVKFFCTENKDLMPEVNFANHCYKPVSPDYPKLYRCPEIESGIMACQKVGTKVLISLGGATGYNVLDDQKADILAQNLWDLFLEGTGQEDIRPFGSAILDGIDLDIEDHLSGGYAQLVKKLRELEATGTKPYLMTGAPQCPNPDLSLGPGSGTALGEQGDKFDHLYVQFYNNPCYPGDPTSFNLDTWLKFAADTQGEYGSGPKIFVGLPAATGGSGDPKYYMTPEEVSDLYQNIQTMNNSDYFGGFMLWDAAWDQQNTIAGQMYSDYIADIISGETPTTPGISSTASGGTTVPTTAATTQTTSGFSSTVPPTVGPDFCDDKEDGFYADPTDPSGYIRCVGGITYFAECPDGLVWVEEELSCDYPQ